MRLCSFRRLFIISPQDSELSDAEVDRSGIGPRFNLSEIKSGIQEDAPPSAEKCIGEKSVLN